MNTCSSEFFAQELSTYKYLWFIWWDQIVNDAKSLMNCICVSLAKALFTSMFYPSFFISFFWSGMEVGSYWLKPPHLIIKIDSKTFD